MFRIEVVDPLSGVHVANPEQVQTHVVQVLQNPGGLPSDVISTNVGSLADIAIKHIASFQTGVVCLVNSLRANLHNAQQGLGNYFDAIGSRCLEAR